MSHVPGPETEENFRVFCLRATRENVPRLSEFILSEAKAAGVQENRLFELEVILEEILCNTADHAYQDHNQPDGWVKVGIDPSTKNGVLRLKVEDAGVHFNVLTHPPPDTESPVLERAIGGLGVHLFRQLALNSRYERTPDGLNRLSFDIPIS
jgi:serine/threonine-protein kinase RsbW